MAFVAADSDRSVTCPSLKIAKTVSPHIPTYAYSYAHLQKQCDAAILLNLTQGNDPTFSDWASHGAEILLVFDNDHFMNPLSGGPLTCDFTGEEKALSASMMSLWTTFNLRRPVDDSGAHVVWQSFNNSQPQTLGLSIPTSSLLPDFKKNDCAFWASLGT